MDKKEIRTRIIKYLDNNDISYDAGDGNGNIEFVFSQEDEFFEELNYLLVPFNGGFLSFVFSPWRARPETIPQFVEYVAMLNTHMGFGNFEINPESGDLRFRMEVYVDKNSSLPEETIDFCINESISYMNAYGDGFMRLYDGEELSDDDIYEMGFVPFEQQLEKLRGYGCDLQS